MTSTTEQNGTPQARSAMVLAILIIALFGLETHCLDSWHRSNEELYTDNFRRASQNALDLRRITDLRAAASRIDGLYLRLQDPMTSTSQNIQQLPSLDGTVARQNGAEPIVIHDFLKAGFAAVPSNGRRPDSSMVYELGSNHLEFHRLVPLIAQEENSNVFLFIDHLEFIRPRTTMPFSVHPTALQARLTARVLTPATR